MCRCPKAHIGGLAHYCSEIGVVTRGQPFHVSVSGVNGWKKPESVKTHFRAAVFWGSFVGYQQPLTHWNPCDSALWPIAARVRICVCYFQCLEGWQVARIFGPFSQTGFSVQLEIKKSKETNSQNTSFFIQVRYILHAL